MGPAYATATRIRHVLDNAKRAGVSGSDYTTFCLADATRYVAGLIENPGEILQSG
jgi:hypothetical protein